MEMLICVLSNPKWIEEIFELFSHEGIFGATVLESQGMARVLSENSELSFMSSIFSMLDTDHINGKTFFMVVCKEQIPKVSEIINKVTGGLHKKDTGILFTVPVRYTEGFVKKED